MSDKQGSSGDGPGKKGKGKMGRKDKKKMTQEESARQQAAKHAEPGAAAFATAQLHAAAVVALETTPGK